MPPGINDNVFANRAANDAGIGDAGELRRGVGQPWLMWLRRPGQGTACFLAFMLQWSFVLSAGPFF